jgi:hypothetical protein
MTTRPGAPLLKEGMPVPEPITMSSSNNLCSDRSILYKIITKGFECNSISSSSKYLTIESKVDISTQTSREYSG